MVIVAGFWELGWNTPIMEYNLWHYPMRDFGVKEIAMIPISGIRKKGIKEFPNVEELVKYYNLPVVVCDEKGQTSLKGFEHPENVLYLFGKASYSPLGLFTDAQSVVIPTSENKGLLWPHQAASIILYDRFLKNGNNNS